MHCEETMLLEPLRLVQDRLGRCHSPKDHDADYLTTTYGKVMVVARKIAGGSGFGLVVVLGQVMNETWQLHTVAGTKL